MTAAAKLPPAVALSEAGRLYSKRGEQATPGPWERPLNVRNKACVAATLPGDESPRTWRDGTDPETGQRERVTVALIPTWSNGMHMRERNGRDLEWIALANPEIAEPLAAMLAAEAKRVGKYNSPVVQVSMADQHLLKIAYDAIRTPAEERYTPEEYL